MKDKRFKRIISEILKGEVYKKIDRNDILKEAKEFIKKEDYNIFLAFSGKNAKILDEKVFEKFVFWKLDIKSWKDFEKEVKSKKESIEVYNNSKRKSIHTDENTIVFRKRNKRAEIFYKEFPKNIKRVVAVENYEAFLRIDFSLFEEENFILLNGFANSLTKEFLKDKEVLFFVDFDFFGIEIFNSIQCKSKDLFLPINLEELLIKYGNRELYKRQLFKKSNLNLENKNAKYLYELINKYSSCLEQEILNVD